MFMPTITRKWKQRKITLVIEGGWEAKVPQITEINNEFSKAWIEYLVTAKMQKSQAIAMRAAAIMHQNMYNYAWRVMLSQSIFYWAKQYAKRYPEQLVEVGKNCYILSGFDPAKMQFAFVPNQKPGTDGLKFVDAMMREMKGKS